jgi:hypothetical protein
MKASVRMNRGRLELPATVALSAHLEFARARVVAKGKGYALTIA